MKGLLEFDSAMENGIGWLDDARSWLSEEKEDTNGQWKEVVGALEKLNAAIALLREARTPLLPAIKAEQNENDQWANRIDALDNKTIVC